MPRCVRLADEAQIQTIVPQARSALDELVALSAELETVRMLDDLTVSRERQSSPNSLLLHTLAVLPFLADCSRQGIAQSLFSDPAILVQSGSVPAEFAEGVSAHHRHSHGKKAASVPVRINTLRDELARLSAADWENLQEGRLLVLYAKWMICSTKAVVDESGRGEGERLVTLSALTGHGLIPLAWEFLTALGHPVTQSLRRAIMVPLSRRRA